MVKGLNEVLLGLFAGADAGDLGFDLGSPKKKRGERRVGFRKKGRGLFNALSFQRLRVLLLLLLLLPSLPCLTLFKYVSMSSLDVAWINPDFALKRYTVRKAMI